MSLSNLLIFRIVLAVLGPLQFCVHFRMSLSISTKKAVGILLGIASDSKDHLEYYCHSKNIVGTPLVVPWLRICLPMQGTGV